MGHTITCCECDEEIEGTVIQEEFGDWTDFPEECPNCSEPLDTGVDGGSGREDFHSDI